jgi:hypothetical protein
MNQDRSRKQLAKKMFKQPVTKFTAVDLENAKSIPRGMTRAYKNNRFVVMVYDNSIVTTGTATRVLIQRIDNLPILGHWAEIQKIKNELFGEETIAIEYYPAKSKLIDDFNIYWIWIFPDGILPLPVM